MADTHTVLFYVSFIGSLGEYLESIQSLLQKCRGLCGERLLWARKRSDRSGYRKLHDSESGTALLDMLTHRGTINRSAVLS